ncbi:MAG TPA: prepilin-type N-terminal cleavage/methylation domain-containing protein [Thermoanaerobaculia bacterium]|jgi:prepilin-type N-terminal cleavage/methylation domain-containing protein|nr:prepilin-type N-terminal cleavage/methylation domain-containing protein [Thermoanaerobaculia bacterium]
MLNRLRKRQKGFTLIELLIVVAIIGIIAALLIPNFLDALQKAKQKRTVADMRNTGTAMFSWLTDQVGAAAAGQNTVALGSYDTITQAALSTLLVPVYMQDVPKVDGWKGDYDFYLKTGSKVLEQQVMLIRSKGRGGAADAGPFTVTSFDPTDYAQDIVWADGFFVRWPQKQ